jgi:hypothetical protein
LKTQLRPKFKEARQRFVLTHEEKRVVGFVLAAFVLGLGTKCYRDAHPFALASPAKETSSVLDAAGPGKTPAKKRGGKSRKATPQPTGNAEKPTSP